MAFADITVTQAREKLAAGVPLIDVRTAAEWAEGHAEGAEHKPLGTFGLDDLPAGPVMFICASGGRSAQVAEAVAAHGREAFNVAGGTRAWIEAGLPTA